MKKHFLRLLMSAVLAVLLIISAVPAWAAGSPSGKKETHTYDIAVVYDNSSSMYNGSMWCQAKYAMEIFASMLDYSRDTLTIYPMWEVQTVEKPAKTDEKIAQPSERPIDIRSVSDIEKIHYMYTTVGGTTPFAPVNDAAEALKHSSATDKWLIVLTDGEFSDGDADDLPKYADLSDNIKVQYLAMGSAAKGRSSKESQGFYAEKAKSGEDLNDALISICNRIFERNKLPDSAFDNGKVSLDVSMSRLIVFVQGNGAEILSIEGPDGSSEVVSNSGQRTYSGREYSLGRGDFEGGTVIGVGQKDEAKTVVDDTLFGQVVVFGSCRAGEYSLNYRGDADKVQIFYEPDVRIRYTLTKDGDESTVIDETTLAAGPVAVDEGEYILDYYLIDGVTGESVKSSELLGKVKMSGHLEYDGGEAKEVEAGDKVTLLPDETATFSVDGTYLDGKYAISTKDTQGVLSLSINPIITHELEVDVSSDQFRDFYYIKDADTWEPMVIGVTMDGNPMTDEQLENVSLNITSDPQVICSEPKIIPGESAFEVYIGKSDPGGDVDIDAIKQSCFKESIFNATRGVKISAEASYTPEDTEVTISDGGSKSVKVSKVPQALIDLFFLIIIAALLALALLIYIILRNWKCFPRKVKFVCSSPKKSTKTINLKLGSNGLTIGNRQFIKMLKPIKKANVLNRRSKNATFGIKGFRIDDSQLTDIMIGGQRFTQKVQGRFIDRTGKPVNWSNYQVDSVHDGFMIQYTTVGDAYGAEPETYVCKFVIN